MTPASARPPGARRPDVEIPRNGAKKLPTGASNCPYALARISRFADLQYGSGRRCPAFGQVTHGKSSPPVRLRLPIPTATSGATSSTDTTAIVVVPGRARTRLAGAARMCCPSRTAQIADEDDRAEDDTDEPGRGSQPDAKCGRRREAPLGHESGDRQHDEHRHEHVRGGPLAVCDEECAAEEEHRACPADESEVGCRTARRTASTVTAAMRRHKPRNCTDVEVERARRARR